MHGMPGQLITTVGEHEVSTLPTEVANDRRVARTVIFLRGGATIDIDAWPLPEQAEHDRAVTWLGQQDQVADILRVTFKDDAEPAVARRSDD